MAAGLGFKTFTTGEVLTAADVNGYLMQGVLVFASEAARNSAITSPQEGQFAFTKDTNSLWYYTGSAWAASGATGDIEGVTAGTGISGGGTSGTVTITNSMATEITAKGDLIVGTGNAAFDNLPVGTNGHVLTADSTVSPTGLKWAAPAGGGKVLQVVSAVYSTAKTIASTSYTDTDLTASITPSSASSKVLVIVNQQVFQIVSASLMAGLGMKLLRGATDIFDMSGSDFFSTQYLRASGTSALQLTDVIPMTYLDSPNTTSSTTYKTQSRLENTGSSASSTFQYLGASSSITLIEIGA
jgi:hypothetical protein